jgi:TonB-linked SusC/RagA family outer membrane protein
MSIKIDLCRIFIVGMFFQFLISSAKAQDATPIKGKVVDEQQQPLPGISIKVKDKPVSTSTNQNGDYILTITDLNTVTLVFSSIGYISQEIKLTAGRTTYNISLKSSNESLDDVIIIGYGTSRKKDLTGSVASVNIKDMQKAPVASFDQALAGRVAGVQVSASDGQPGSDLNIVVRGNNSITQNNSPLYVVDGFPIETNLNTLLSPSEIESIEVLKDASATAIYGARGANGVIIVTTKKGTVSAPILNFQSSYGVQTAVKKMEVMDAYEFVRYQLDLNPTMYEPIYLTNGRNLETYRNIQGVDWQDLLFRNAPMQNYSVSLRGGTAQTKYSASGSLLDQEGIILNGGFKRYQGRLVLDQKINEKAKAGINVNYSSAQSYGTRVGAAQGSPSSTLMYSIWGYRPVTGTDEGEADLIDEPYDPDVNPSTDLRFNPLLTATNTYNPSRNNTLLANAYIDYNILSNLALRITGGVTTTTINNEVFNNSNTQSGNPISSINGVNGSITKSLRNNYLNENTLTYTPEIGKNHSFTALGGFTMQKVDFESSGYTSIQIPNEVLGISGIDEGIISRGTSSKTTNTLVSVLSRINYSYKSKYLLTASFRADGSSKFYTGNKWSFFPSASAAWRISDEPFLKDVKFISDAKIRGGYGLTGNNRVSDFAYLSSYNITASSGYSYNNAPVQGIIPNDLGTRDLKWETTAQTDIGVDIGLFKNRISLTADYYKKTTRDLLLNASIAPSMGYLAGFKNIGKVSNSGLEFSLNTRNIETKNFSWSSSFNISFNRNKVLQLNEGQSNLQTAITWGNFSSAAYVAIPGQPISQFYGYTFDGVYQFNDFDLVGSTYTLKAGVPNNGMPRTSIEPGMVKYKDINGDGEVNGSDIGVIGNPNPKHIGGFGNNFAYKNFDLNVFLQWSYGNELMNVNRIEFEGGEARNFLNMFASYADRWTPTNPSNTLYKAGGHGPAVYSSRVIEDGSYLRIKTVSLGYNLSPEVLKRIKIKNLRVFASGQNLLTWTNYSGPDPEVSVRNSALTPGFDLSAYPQARTITFGLNLTL